MGNNKTHNMKKFGNWLVQNLSHIFSIIGIALSLYFGVYYVPDWLAENQKEKVLNAQKNLEQTIKELVFDDTTCSYNEIQILIKAKEIEINETYPFTTIEVLIKVQESFMQDRFLPLVKRRELMAKVETIKKEIPITNKKVKIKETNKSSLLGILSIILTLITVLTGIISYYIRYIREKEKDEEIANQINQIDNISIEADSAHSYEKKIKRVITEIPGVKIKQENQITDYLFDIVFEYQGQTYFVECKYLSHSKVGLNSIERFVSQVKGLEGNFLFVYNTDLTDMVKNRVNELRKILFLSNRRNLFLINATTEEDFKLKLKTLLKIT